MLEEVDWLAPKFIILYVFFGTMMFIHLRGRVRLRFYRQLTDHSTLMAPYNTLMYMFSAVPNRPFIDVDRFPELKSLTENWRTIRDEAIKLFDEGHIRAAAGYTDLGFNSFFRRADIVKMANLAQIVNVLQAVILTKEEKLVLTPTYHVMEMYNVHQDATMLPLTITTNSYQLGKEKQLIFLL